MLPTRGSENSVPLDDLARHNGEMTEAPGSPRSFDRSTSVSSDPARFSPSSPGPGPTDRRTSSASASYFNSRRHRQSLTSSRSLSVSLTPAETHLWRSDSSQKSGAEGNPVLLELSEDDEIDNPWDPPIATTRCLQQFAKVIGRRIDPDVTKKKQDRLRQSQIDQGKHEVTLAELRAWARRKEENRSIGGWVTNFFKYGRSPKRPDDTRLLEMAKFYYPLRGELKCYVCDFGDGKFSRKEVFMSEIDEYLYEKPDWATVRWIHAPLNLGLVHSTLEDRFLVVDRDPTKTHTKDASWPYAQIETVSLRKRKDLVAMKDAQTILRQYDELKHITNKLNDKALLGLSEEMENDIRWRSGHMGVPANYWNLVTPDFQRQLSGGVSLHVDSTAAQLSVLKVDQQAISEVPLYAQSQIVRYGFRCFHRSDGFLLTMAASGGVDYIDKDMNDHLNMPKDCCYDQEDASVVGLLFELFSTTGTATWYKKNLDYFLIYLLTEIAAKPHNIRRGCNAPQLARAYQQVVQQLKDKRYAEFKRNESVKLVRQYLSCIDELTTVSSILDSKMEMLQNLRKKAEEEDGDGEPDNPDGESAKFRVNWAISTVEEKRAHHKELLSDLHQSLNALFQLRSIEQNELAIVADSQNKAILVFTAVTIIFLPLSFFTSYYGMNLKGIVDTAKSESYFWKVCGSTGFVVILVVSLWAFRHRLLARMISRVKAEHHMV